MLIVVFVGIVVIIDVDVVILYAIIIVVLVADFSIFNGVLFQVVVFWEGYSAMQVYASANASNSIKRIWASQLDSI